LCTSANGAHLGLEARKVRAALDHLDVPHRGRPSSSTALSGERSSTSRLSAANIQRGKLTLKRVGVTYTLRECQGNSSPAPPCRELYVSRAQSLCATEISGPACYGAQKGSHWRQEACQGLDAAGQEGEAQVHRQDWQAALLQKGQGVLQDIHLQGPEAGADLSADSCLVASAADRACCA